MPLTRLLDSPDRLNRRVLFAVEVIDPIAHALVSQGVTVQATGVTGRPLVSWSGRFVWLEEGNAWPETVTVQPQSLPFATHTAVAPPRPGNIGTATAAERLLRIVLRPTPAYAFDQGTTAIRGRLRESLDPQALPVARARVQLAWRDDQNDRWLPPPPAAEDVDDDADAPSPREAETNDRGEFAVFLQLRPGPSALPDIVGGLLKVRLQVTRGRANPVTRSTPEDFPFLPGSENGANAPPRGRVAEGQLLGRDLSLAWTQLESI